MLAQVDGTAFPSWILNLSSFVFYHSVEFKMVFYI